MVIESGEKVADLKVGDRVVTVGLDGSHAELRAVPAGFCWKIPDGLSTEEAACVPVAYETAHDCLFVFGRLQAGESVLVQAGASGVGIAAIQMAKKVGARVLATASSDSKLERLREFGLDDGINYVTSQVVAEVLSLTEGRGVDVVLESVGGRGLNDSLECLGYRGRCVSLGDAGRGGPAMVDAGSLRAEEPDTVRLFPRSRAASCDLTRTTPSRKSSKRSPRGASGWSSTAVFRSRTQPRPTLTSRAGRPSAG